MLKECEDGMLDWITAIAAVGAVAASIIGTFSIKSAMSERLADSLGGFYAQLNSHLIILKQSLRKTHDESILLFLFSTSGRCTNIELEKERQEFKKKAKSAIEHIKTKDGQLYFSDDIKKNLEELICQLSDCLRWSSNQFCEDFERRSKYDDFAKVLKDTMEEIDRINSGGMKKMQKFLKNGRKSRKKHTKQKPDMNNTQHETSSLCHAENNSVGSYSVFARTRGSLTSD